MKAMSLPVFLARTDLQSGGRGCWIWRGSRFKGYGCFSIGKRRTFAHRWAYEHWCGPIPAGLVIDHLCRVPACVNPMHLEPVTGAENISRGHHWYRSRTHCPRGHPYDAANTYRWRGGRYCIACSRVRSRLAQRRRRAARKAARRI